MAKDKRKKQADLIEGEQVKIKKWSAQSIRTNIVGWNMFALLLVLGILSIFFNSQITITQDELRTNYLMKSSVYKKVITEAPAYFERLSENERLLSEFSLNQDQENAKRTVDEINFLKDEQIKQLFDNLHNEWDNFFPASRIRYIILTDKNLNTVYSYSGKEDSSSFKYSVVLPANSNGNKSPIFRVTEYGFHNVKKDLKTVSLALTKDKNVEAYMFIGFPAFEAKNKSVTDTIIFLILSFFIVLGFSFTVSKRISYPLKDMEEKISRMTEGDLSERLEYTKLKEINRLVQSYNELANTMQRLYSTLEAKVYDRTKELKSAYAELQNTQAIMVHSEKMKSLGELVAGIMHEINNPINFIYGNMTHLDNYSKDLIKIIESYEKYEDELKEEMKKDVNGLKKDIDYDFLKSDMPDLIKSCKEGAERAKNIIQDLKSFSRMEEAAISDVDIPHEIDMTLNILHNKIKHKAEVHKEYIDYVPKVEAFGGQLNQVFMNIIDNAVGAIKEKGDIWIRIKTNELQSHLFIEIEDNGVGMDKETSRRTFDPFFTTKPVGQGTGLGMSIAHKIIKSHQGQINVTSKKGEGTKFTIKLPLKLDRETLNADLKNEGEIIDG